MSPLFSLAGRVAVITGSSRGIGFAIGMEMARSGAQVVISSRNQAACDAAAAEINAATGREAASPFAASISDKEALRALVAHAESTFGKVDILVCNAASNPYYGPLAEIPDDRFRKILDNNIVANNWLIGMVLPQMRARQDGAIIIVSSIGGFVGSPVIGAYNISKAADMQLARNLAVECGGDNIRVNCIAPGLIKTAFSKALWDDPETYDTYMRGTPLKRAGTPEEIAGAAVFLAGPAGSFVTGQTIVVDGGTTIQGI
ncbi:NAD(P)-dependent dehydrogenase, short-chain alcohol dehydrogenase family [Lutimaribacter pacificus]|uniref:NAD(P)-dependent dehydrogenase, short-chain alcohol dehydrogenase family n=1 Tax=Lutimaribacter pacificus TaxID=391948 RepID=A0A1H0M3X0_9RHOB|nr:SDR family oxidoreductase [Lutimaribacter pacificus]SDO74906.1 NAD(P)-dependent dehydrogenase, short-chain alcohol dehydrogenase family [Lutimaribacter pacificus]SHK77291.1 NAD(P)-dependent dehydrogenase, short-chain alcohol dehydrogenase family [Lutimaribacter pacificus]